MSSLLLDFNVHELVGCGYTTYRFDSQLIEKAQKEFRNLISYASPLPAKEREFVRAGENEPDLGLIRKDGKNGGDDKFYLHFANDLLVPSAGGLRSHPMRMVERIYNANNQAAIEIAQQLHQEYPLFFPDSIVDSIRRAGIEASPYCTNVLRGLYYPRKVGEKQRQGAKKHLDRGFFAQHFGDVGGQLLAFENRHDDVGVPVSPAEGEVLVFFGVKVKKVTGGALEPLWHGSVTEPGEDRQAMVQFNHVEIGEQVRDAGEYYDRIAA